MFNQELLEILICPECRKSVKLDKNMKHLFCANCNQYYLIEDNIPNMLRPRNRHENKIRGAHA
ncbi:Trm112 family protein [Candidatus Margulisiibacteriota bacterium]